MTTSIRTSRERAEFLTDGCDHVETLAELAARIETGRPLRVYLGLDPTSADLHVGHAVVLRLLQRFVEDGHDVILLIGDFTARIGDPSGRNALRPPLSSAQIDANMRTYAAQAGKVLDMSRVTLRYNSEWLSKLHLRRRVQAALAADRRADARAQRLQAALRGRRADRAARVRLPGGGRVRLGRDERRRRARRLGPALQPADQPAVPDPGRPGAGDLHHRPAARGHRRREEDVQVPRQPHRR